MSAGAWGDGAVLPRLVADGQVYGRDELMSFGYTAACCNGDIGIGQVCAASLTATLVGAHALAGQAITAALGESGDGSTLWNSLGAFWVAESRQYSGCTVITAYDAAWYALGAAYAPTVQSGATVAAVLEDVADQCGLDVEQTTLNYGLHITVAGTLAGHRCRDMLGYLAALCGRNCIITRAGAIRFVWFEASGASYGPDDTYPGGTASTGSGALTGLLCSVPDGDGTAVLSAGDAESAVEIACPYMSQARLDAIWSALGGYSYPVMEVSLHGGAAVEPGDVVAITSLDQSSVSLPVMEVSLAVDGGCRCTLRSFGRSGTVRGCDAAGAGPVEQRLRRVQSTADTALLSANGKNKNFYRASAPTAADGLTAGDLWFDTANGNRVSEWTGSAWVLRQFGALAVTDLDAGSITTGTLNAARIGANSIGAGKLSVNALSTITANAGTLTAGVLQSSNYSAGAAGTKLDLTNGTADITGTIRAQAGNIGDFNISSGGFTFHTDEVGGTEVELIPSEAYFPDYVFLVSKRISATSSEIKIALGRNGDIDASGNISCIGSATINRGLSVLEGATVYRGLEVATGDLDVAGSIKHYGNPYLKSASRGISYSCAAGASYGDTLTFGVSISGEPGYVPIGIIGWTTGSSSVALARLYLGNGNTELNFTVLNTGSTAVSGTLNVVFLFQAD